MYRLRRRLGTRHADAGLLKESLEFRVEIGSDVGGVGRPAGTRLRGAVHRDTGAGVENRSYGRGGPLAVIGDPLGVAADELFRRLASFGR